MYEEAIENELAKLSSAVLMPLAEVNSDARANLLPTANDEGPEILYEGILPKPPVHTAARDGK
jgi:hypothetical protein